MSNPILDRRTLLAGAAAGLGAAALGGCDRLAETSGGQRALQAGEDANLFVQRLLLSDATLAPEYAETDISPWFKPNGTSDPPDRAYKALARRKFADFQLEVNGLVERPLKLSLVELRKMPARTQITRHDCVEGWSCIGKWTGVPVRELLQRAGLRPSARYIVLHCADTMEDDQSGEGEDSETNNPQMEKRQQARRSPSRGSQDQRVDDGQDGSGGDGESRAGGAAQPVRYYESIDLRDAHHPQTILAYEMNGAPLPVEHGAPLRLRLERQLGYKMAKYVMRLELVESYSHLGEGRGGYWEDRGYDWYAGI